jgi:UDP-2,3-diacylglucosamine pyrophosphatase LpxH
MTRNAIYFISDTHLGDGTGADRFRYPAQLRELLFKIESEPGAELVLLGDLMELWAAPLEAVLIHHADLFHSIARIAATRPVTYVVGNHDCLPWYYFLDQSAGNLQIVEQFSADRGALVALHGHQFDPFNRVKVTDAGQVKAPWTRRLVNVIGFLGRVGGEPTSDAIEHIGDRVAQAANSLETLLPHLDANGRLSVRRGLEQTKNVFSRESPGERGYPVGERVYDEAAFGIIRRGARHVVMGHTHHPLVQSYGAKSYVNTGSWVWDRYPPTYARYSEGKLTLLDANTHAPYVDQ